MLTSMEFGPDAASAWEDLDDSCRKSSLEDRLCGDECWDALGPLGGDVGLDKRL